MADDHPEDCACCSEGPEAFFARLEETIRQYGHSVLATAVETPVGNLPMSYTIGLADAGLPEIVTFGLSGSTAHQLLNDAAKLLREGKLPVDAPVTKLGNLPLVFKHVPAARAAEYVIQANNRAGKELPVLQMVWPDPKGKFPWDARFQREFYKLQPALYQCQ